MYEVKYSVKNLADGRLKDKSLKFDSFQKAVALVRALRCELPGPHVVVGQPVVAKCQ